MLIFRNVGRYVLSICEQAGKIFIFAFGAIAHIFIGKFYFRVLFKQMIDIGFYSLPVVGLTAIFTGMVLALQTYGGLEGGTFVPRVVVVTMVQELGPVLTGLMVAGRIGASMAAELGTMRVTEQIDALTTLSTNPVQYLVTPRILAGVIMLPVLVIIADIIGVMGGYVLSTTKLGIDDGVYLTSTLNYLMAKDVIVGVVKVAVFGFIVTLMGCYHGFFSRGGAEGVGRATTNSVVSASILILFSNYLITELFFIR